MAIYERRNNFRMPICLGITEEYRTEIQQVTALNISEHGLHYLRPLEEQERAGKEVLLTFTLLEHHQPIKVIGWVVKERVLDDKIATHVAFMFSVQEDEDTVRDFIKMHNNQLCDC